MDNVTLFLIQHGGLVVFAVVLAEQVGLPIPAFPVLLAAGALVGVGKIDVMAAMAFSVAACLLGDLLWYYLGRLRGAKVLQMLCRISLEPDSCVRRTEAFFLRHGTRSLVFAKFLPGFSTLTPALAGLFGVTVQRFMIYTGLGGVLWSGTAIGMGYLFTEQLEWMAIRLGHLGSSVVALLVMSLALYIAYKYLHRHRLLRTLRMARITVEELRALMEKRPETVIIDLRLRTGEETDSIPGALRMSVEDLTRRHQEIPRDREVVLFCDCPNEVTAARMALLLRRNGITRVRPLAGGIAAWRLSAASAVTKVMSEGQTVVA